MQVANDAASANELPPVQAGALTTPPLPESCRAASREDCVEGALERGLAGRERGVRGV